MLSRALFFVLLTANIGLYGWYVYQEVNRPTPPPDPVAGAPQLVLLAEREAELLEAGDVNLAGALGETTCFTFGPFITQADLRRAFNVLAPYVDKSRQRQTVETRDRGFWVYLPAVASREEALAVARELSVVGLRDYYVVTAGDQENTISLGLFREESNARRRRDALQTLGFDAQMARRTEESINYWLDYARRPESEPPWERIVAASNGIEHRPIPCFRESGGSL